MRKILFIAAALALSLGACKSSGEKQGEETTKGTGKHDPNQPVTAGAPVKIEEAITGKELKEKLSTVPSFTGTVKGDLLEVCKREGCWVRIDLGDGTSMQVNFEGHKFFVDKNLDIADKTVYAEGVAHMDTLSAEQLRHYAEDQGKPQAEIDAITESQTEIVFTARGIEIR